MLIPVYNAYAETVYNDYTSLVTSGAEPFGIECSADGYVFMTTFSGTEGGLLKIDKSNPSSATFVSQSTGADWFSVEYDNNGNLFINERDNGLVWKYVASSGTFSKFAVVEQITSTSGATVTYPNGFNTEPDLIHIDLTANGVGNDYILNVNLGGHAGEVQLAKGFIWVSVNYAIDFATDVNTAGIADTSFYGLAKINPSTSAVTLIDLESTGATDIRGISSDGDYLWITSQANNKIFKFDTSSGSIVETITLSSGSNPRGIANNAAYVFVALNKASGGNSEVLRIDKTDLTQTVIDTGATNDNGGTFTVFTSGDVVLWTDESGNTGNFLSSGESKVITDTSAQTSKNHYGCQVGTDFWFAGKGSVKTGITGIPQTSILSDGSGGDGDIYLSRPTIGKSHDTLLQIVDYGFFHNENKYAITDNFYTATEKIPIITGESNHFGIKTYVGDAKVMVGEISLVPEIGAFEKAEVRLESHFDFDGTLKEIKVIQKDNVIQRDIITSYQTKMDCMQGSGKEDCIYISFDNVVFMESPVFEKIAINVINNKRQYNITYLNDGFSFEGMSFNPPLMTKGIIDKGYLVDLTRIDKKNNLWISNDVIYKLNDFGTFIRITPYKVILSPDGPVNVMERNHSDFKKIIEYEKNRALEFLK